MDNVSIVSMEADGRTGYLTSQARRSPNPMKPFGLQVSPSTTDNASPAPNTMKKSSWRFEAPKRPARAAKCFHVKSAARSCQPARGERRHQSEITGMKAAKARKNEWTSTYADAFRYVTCASIAVYASASTFIGHESDL